MTKFGSLARCRYCGTPLEHVFADLGSTALANRNLKSHEVEGEQRYPLIARICGNCLLVQVDDSVPPGEIFSDYDYFSSFSSSWVAHAKRYADQMIDRFSLSGESRVVEIASNDGYLLQHFQARGIEVLGVDPAANVAQAAIAKGISTEVGFFGRELARSLAARGLKADVMAANNVLAHVPDTLDFAGGFAELLKPDGVATFEFPHVLRQIEHLQFDTIYHEHFFYLSLYAVEQIFRSAGMRVFDIEELPTHGGSLRVFACLEYAAHRPQPGLFQMRALERDAKLDQIEGYLGFKDRIAGVRQSFREFLEGARAEGRTVAAYGAAAKGNTFLNFCGVVHPEIIAVFDRNPAKQGKLTPGSHIPIHPPEKIAELRPDYMVILPWNLADEIRADIDLSPWHGRFVIAAGQTRVLG